MPLSPPAPRRRLHIRAIECTGYQRDDGLWDIEGRLVDSKSYDFANRDRGGIKAGEPLHDISVRLTVDDDLEVRAAEASGDAGPYGICGDIVGVIAGLVGRKIGPGWRKAVIDVMGRTKGCTHLSDMVMGPVAVTAYQTIAPVRQAAATDNEDFRPPHLGSCHALATDGPVVQLMWPDAYRGEDDPQD